MNTKNTLRTNLEALHLSTKPPVHQAPPKTTKPNKKPRTSPAAGRTSKKRATPARPAPKGGDGDEGGEGGDGDDADPGEGTAPLADEADRGEGTAPLADEADPGEGTAPLGDDVDPGEGTAPLAGKPEGVVAFAREPEGAAAVARVQADLDALPRDEVRRISVHVPTAAAIALGALPRLLRLRDAIVALPGHPPDALAKLRDYALAASYAHALAQPRGEDETHLRELLREAMPLRERLLRGAEALAQFGLADATRVASIRRGTGYLDAAQDLTALGALFRELWPAVAAQTPITRPE
ncbi:MAG TPA: hypothetical protein VFS00_18505, partial [Polyangiaceae bacterium]|nr:hypothetical protein [Polyangiaceae bacterium]